MDKNIKKVTIASNPVGVFTCSTTGRVGSWVDRQWQPIGGFRANLHLPQSNPNFDPEFKYEFNMNKKLPRGKFDG